MKILVTGGAGFIGSNYVEFVLTSDPKVEKIVVYDNFSYAANQNNLAKWSSDPRFSLIRGDITETTAVRDALREITHVVHFAAESHVDRSISTPALFSYVNSFGSAVLLEESFRANITRFLHVSTDEVYGSIEEGSFSEGNVLNPSSPYSASKAASDLLALSYFRTFGFNISVTRCTNNYGKYQYPEKLIPFFINKLLNREQIPIYGDGKNVRDWIHVTDHVRGVHQALLRGRAGEIYNFAGGNEFSNLVLAQKLLQYFNLSGDYIQFVEDRAGHDFRYSVDASKSVKELSFSPRIEFEVGLKQTIDWYVHHRDWWSNS
jgi:dTDP-glucose 4,6-dehydratase